jgi:phage portal protein BeeE
MLLSDGALAPVSLADSTPTLRSTTFYPTGGLSFTARHATYAQVYKSQLWVSTLVNKIATATARLPLKVYERVDEGREDAADTAYGRLIANPNPRHDPYFFWLWTVSTVEVYGEAFWYKLRAATGSRPSCGLYPCPGRRPTRREGNAYVYEYVLGLGASSRS